MIRSIALLALATALTTSTASYAQKRFDHYGLGKHMAEICVKELNETYKKVPAEHYKYSEAVRSSGGVIWWTTISYYVHKKWKDDNSISVLPYETECGVDTTTFEIYDLDKPVLMINSDFTLIK